MFDHFSWEKIFEKSKNIFLLIVELMARINTGASLVVY